MLPVLLALLVLVGVMVWASRVVVSSFETIASGIEGEKRFTMVVLLVALGTSLPELSIAFSSAMSNQASLSIGNLMGSNVANASLLVGLTAIVASGLSVVGEFARHEIAAAFVAGVAPLILLIDGELSRLDGLILVVSYLIYFRDLILSDKHKIVGKGLMKRAKFMYEMRQLVFGKHKGVSLKLLGGLVALIACSDLVVRMSSGLALMMSVDRMVVGITILAFGSSLPEIILSMTSIRQKRIALVFGNLLGSVVTNSTLIMGILAMIRPVQIAAAPNLAIANLSYVFVFGLLWLFVSTRKKLEQWEGLVLVGIYLMTVGLQFMAG